MPATDHLAIGTISFARRHQAMMVPSAERQRLILAAVRAYAPDLLVTAGHTVDTRPQLDRLAAAHAAAETATTIVTEVTYDREAPGKRQDNAMYALTGTGCIHAFGRQRFGLASAVARANSPALAAFEASLPARSFAIPDWNLFALVCGELNIVRGRIDPRFRSAAARDAVFAADIVINPTHDRMGNGGTLDAKRRFLSRAADDGRNRVYISVSNWETAKLGKRPAQRPSATLHTVYAAGKPVAVPQTHADADGAFGFCYRQWALAL